MRPSTSTESPTSDDRALSDELAPKIAAEKGAPPSDASPCEEGGATVTGPTPQPPFPRSG